MIPDLYRCQLCEQTFPVPSLARDCEAKHLADPDPEENP